MNRSLERFAICAGVIVLLFSLQFGACLGGGAVALPAALLLGVGFTLLWTYFDLPASPLWLSPVLCSITVLLSVAIANLAIHDDFAEWFSFALTAAGSGMTLYFIRRGSERCGLCNRRLATQSLSFRCPRCSLQVCDERCWNFEHRRCTNCLEQRVPLLPTQNQWWTSVAGPRSPHGRCQVCLASASQVDLRTCPNCRRPQCIECWDHQNGECQRCGSPLPDLPASLKTTVACKTEVWR